MSPSHNQYLAQAVTGDVLCEVNIVADSCDHVSLWFAPAASQWLLFY
jgi:hypothetical protein